MAIAPASAGVFSLPFVESEQKVLGNQPCGRIECGEKVFRILGHRLAVKAQCEKMCEEKWRNHGEKI